MSLDLNQCDKLCHQCIKDYIKLHKLKKGDTFDVIGCRGIPTNYISDDLLSSLGEDPETARAILDPVLWAKEFLDWHCIDPEGKEWKRKADEGTLGGLPTYDAKRAKAGKSIFHRPYQSLMLRCNALRKVFLIGRQAGKTETLCIAIVYNMFTREKFHVEVIAPFQAQIDLIFKRLMELINSNAMLRNSIQRSVKAPTYTIELKNGSQCIGFTAGTSSKQEAGASRGQHANMLVFDEADMLSPADVDAALAVIINYPDATVWMSSTPTGKREKFYDSCFNRQYRRFHYPSYVNPNWTPELEAYFRSELTADGYTHEIEALFGEQEEGVYRLKYVEAAQSDYEYDHMKPDPRWSYMMGVDWNKLGQGTTIAVVGLNPNDGYLYLVDKQNIPASNRTQLNACQRVAELNRLWNASYIYIDIGYGSVQQEILHDYGQRCVSSYGPNHPDSRLRNIVKGYDFGSSIEIRDLFTKQPVKKPAKPFLVENSVRRFENMQFKYPASDKSYTDQLLGYIIDRVSVTGRPLYKQQNEKAGDHFLDAVNLALVAFMLEKSQFGRPIYNNAIAFAGRFGEARDVKPSSSMIKQSEDHRPQGGRASMMKPDEKLFKSMNGEVPAANTYAETSVRPWSWSGFLRDEPRPHMRSSNKSMRDIDRRILRPLGKTRPRRKKF